MVGIGVGAVVVAVVGDWVRGEEGACASRAGGAWGEYVLDLLDLGLRGGSHVSGADPECVIGQRC